MRRFCAASRESPGARKEATAGAAGVSATARMLCVHMQPGQRGGQRSCGSSSQSDGQVPASAPVAKTGTISSTCNQATSAMTQRRRTPTPCTRSDSLGQTEGGDDTPHTGRWPGTSTRPGKMPLKIRHQDSLFQPVKAALGRDIASSPGLHGPAARAHLPETWALAWYAGGDRTNETCAAANGCPSSLRPP